MEITEKRIYHITSIDNLESILEQQGIYSKHEMNKISKSYTNIAHSNIQERRTAKLVPVYPYQTLHHYVPFYFSPKSPMLYAIKQGKVTGFQGRQDSVIYIVSSINKIVTAQIPYVFTDGHGIINYTEFYNNLNDLNQIDWDVMESRYWFDTDDDPDRKRRRQAEFLVYKSLPLTLILGIGVKNDLVKDKVENLLEKYHINLKVKVLKHWYY